MKYEKKHWPVLDAKLYRKAGNYDRLATGIAQLVPTIRGAGNFLKSAGISPSHIERLIQGITTPRPETLIRIIAALINERNFYHINKRHGNQSTSNHHDNPE